jgi:hypothetical protein
LTLKNYQKLHFRLFLKISRLRPFREREIQERWPLKHFILDLKNLFLQNVLKSLKILKIFLIGAEHYFSEIFSLDEF